MSQAAWQDCCCQCKFPVFDCGHKRMKWQYGPPPLIVSLYERALTDQAARVVDSDDHKRAFKPYSLSESRDRPLSATVSSTRLVPAPWFGSSRLITSSLHSRSSSQQTLSTWRLARNRQASHANHRVLTVRIRSRANGSKRETLLVGFLDSNQLQVAASCRPVIVVNQPSRRAHPLDYFQWLWT